MTRRTWFRRRRRVARNDPPRRLLAAEPLEPRRLLTVFFEDFDGGLPADWSVVDGQSDGHTWTDQNPGGRTSEHWDGTFIIADDDVAPPGTRLSEWLYSPSIDISGRENLTLEFGHYYRSDTAAAGTVQVLNSEGSWTTVATFVSDTAETSVLDISDLADGQATLQIRWHYDDGGASDWFWGIDNVRVFEQVYVPDGISGQKFLDRNVNGQHDLGEEYLNGWTIELRDSQGQLIATDTTRDIDLDDSGDIDPLTERGWYAFANVPAGDYTVGEILQAGWLQTSPQSMHSIQFAGTEPITGLDFGNAAPATIRGTKFVDEDGDGQQDAGEAGLAGWTIFLDNNDNGVFDSGEPSTTTLADDTGTPEDETGTYVFENVPLGDHHVAEWLPGGWDQTFPRYPRTADRASVSTGGTQGNQDVRALSISADGRFVAFESAAGTLVPGDTNNQADIFVHDRLLGITERVSVSDTGEQGNSFSYAPSISADGRWVAFESNASNLVANDTNTRRDVFVYDRQTDTIERMVASDGAQGAAGSYQPGISDDGRFVAFSAERNAFEAGESATTREVYLKDRVTGDLKLVTRSHDGDYSDGGSYQPQITPDGLHVVFYSYASNLVTTDDNDRADVFVYDVAPRETEMVSLASDGITQGDLDSLGQLSISDDGQIVAFASDATNLVPDDDNGKTDVFVFDRQANLLERVSVDAAGNDTLFESHSPSLSSDGRFVVFDSFSPDLVPGDNNSARDLFVVDRVGNTIELVSLSNGGGQGDRPSWGAMMTPDGRYVAAISEARNLIAGDTNNRADVYVFAGPRADTPDVRAIVIGPDETIDGVDFGNVPRADYGDAPEPDYPTTWTANGASHTVVPGLSLGPNVDIDHNGQPNDDATGDDHDVDGNDDDGLRLLDPLVPGQTVRVEFPGSPATAGWLNAWIDFDGTNGWSRPEEQVFSDEPWPQAEYQFTVPAWAEPGHTFARFRLSTREGLSFDGHAPDGEVEDYRLTIRQPPSFQLDVTLTEAPSSNHDPVTGEVDVLPVSLDWIDEWTSFRISIWVSGGGADVTSTSLTWHYNTDYFTAADVEFGPAFENAADLIAAIDDSSGTVQLGGSTTVAGAGDDRPTLFASLHFAASNDDVGLPLSANGNYIEPVTDVGFQVESPLVDRAELGAGAPPVGPLPSPELWPVMYDLDDNNKVFFSDLTFWALDFLRFVGEPGADYAGIADHQHNGRVYFEDLTFFAANFGRVKEDPRRLIYSPNFPAAWRSQPQRAAVGEQDFRSLNAETARFSSLDEEDFGSLEKGEGQRAKGEVGDANLGTCLENQVTLPLAGWSDAVAAGEGVDRGGPPHPIFASAPHRDTVSHQPLDTAFGQTRGPWPYSWVIAPDRDIGTTSSIGRAFYEAKLQFSRRRLWADDAWRPNADFDNDPGTRLLDTTLVDTILSSE